MMRVYEVFKHCKYEDFKSIKDNVEGAYSLDYDSKITRSEVEVLIEELKTQGMFKFSKKLQQVLDEEFLSVVSPSEDRLSSFVINTYSKLLAILGGSNKSFEEKSKIKNKDRVWDINETDGYKKEHDRGPEKDVSDEYSSRRNRR